MSTPLFLNSRSLQRFRTAAAAIALLAGLTPGASFTSSAQKAATRPRHSGPPTVYAYTEIKTMERGPTARTMKAFPGDERRIVRNGSAYRVELRIPETHRVHTIVLNDGVDKNLEFQYRPESGNAKLTLESTLFFFARKYPKEFRAHYVDPHLARIASAGPRCPPFPYYDGPESLGRLTFHGSPGVPWSLVEGMEMVGPFRCRKYRWRGTRQTSVAHCWVDEATSTVVKRTHEATEPGRSIRDTVEIRELTIGQPVPMDEFRLPPGATCRHPSAYHIKVPPGVISLPQPGGGIRF